MQDRKKKSQDKEIVERDRHKEKGIEEERK